jgi:hypothetical protein
MPTSVMVLYYEKFTARFTMRKKEWQDYFNERAKSKLKKPKVSKVASVN